jgi:hypothetical protein
MGPLRFCCVFSNSKQMPDEVIENAVCYYRVCLAVVNCLLEEKNRQINEWMDEGYL